jgi:hypothetical protein
MDWTNWISIVEVPVALAVIGLFVRAYTKLADEIRNELKSEGRERSEADGRLHKRIDDALQSFAGCRVECIQRLEKYVTKEDQHRDSDEIKSWLKRIEEAINALREQRR